MNISLIYMNMYVNYLWTGSYRFWPIMCGDYHKGCLSCGWTACINKWDLLWLPSLSMKACRLMFCEGCDIYGHSWEPLFCSVTHEINAYLQVNDERAVLYCNVNVSCKERGLIQTIVSHSLIYVVYSLNYILWSNSHNSVILIICQHELVQTYPHHYDQMLSYCCHFYFVIENNVHSTYSHLHKRRSQQCGRHLDVY